MLAKGEQIKIVYSDGPVSQGPLRSIRGKFLHEDDFLVAIEREDGILEIGKIFICKIEIWRNKRREFNY